MYSTCLNIYPSQALRRRVNKYGSPLTIYTGTNGVTTLEDKAGNPKKIFLDVDDNNNEILPVPMYFYKVRLFFKFLFKYSLYNFECRVGRVIRDLLNTFFLYF